MAGLQAAALLIAAKRADAISSEIAVHTLQNTRADRELLGENTDLTRVVKTHTDLLEELHQHVTAISEHLGLTAGHFPPKPPRGVERSISSLAPRTPCLSKSHVPLRPLVPWCDAREPRRPPSSPTRLGGSRSQAGRSRGWTGGGACQASIHRLLPAKGQ